MKRTPALLRPAALFTLFVLFALPIESARAADAPKILSIDHAVETRSSVPAVAGQTVKLYVRERVSAATQPRGAGGKVVLFVHGAGRGRVRRAVSGL